MGELQEGFTYFWEILTGVFVDEKSKLLRILCFVTLFLGIIWAGLSYFQAQKIADVSQEFDSSPSTAGRRAKNEAMEKLVEAAQVVGTMRRGGEAIANSLGQAEVSPFNIEGYNELGLEDVSGLTEFAPESEFVKERQEERDRQKQNILIKALMVSGRTRYAVIDCGNEIGSVVYQGQEVPGGEGRITKITPEGITVKVEDDEFQYTIK